MSTFINVDVLAQIDEEIERVEGYLYLNYRSEVEDDGTETMFMQFADVENNLFEVPQYEEGLYHDFGSTEIYKVAYVEPGGERMIEVYPITRDQVAPHVLEALDLL